MIYGFSPIAGPDARVLVLGSMPSVRSLAAGQYYAHPQNAFWTIMAQLFAWESGLDYATRTALLLRTRIALWDVLQAAERPGSLDSAIVAGSERANDFAAFFAVHPAIHSVFFNGTKAEALFQRHVVQQGALTAALCFHRLPSTSPAHAGRSRAEKLAAWQVLVNAVSGAGDQAQP
jgi:double-stranded uracil-DNA glycosylase